MAQRQRFRILHRDLSFHKEPSPQREPAGRAPVIGDHTGEGAEPGEQICVYHWRIAGRTMEKCTGGQGETGRKATAKGIENKWVRDSAIFRWCRVFRVGDSALSSALRFHRSSIPLTLARQPLVPSSLTASYPSLLPLRGKVTPYPRVWPDPEPPSRGEHRRRLGEPRQRMCAAFNGCPPQIYRAHDHSTLGDGIGVM